jgi:thiamine biosynthesis lipoprotein
MELHRRVFKAMGSPCEIQLFAPSRARAQRGIDLAIAEVTRLEALYSRYRDDSLLSEINRVAAAGGRIRVDEETSGLLDYAATCHRESGGLFDVTSGILRRAWGFGRGELPEPSRVAELLDRVGWHRLDWSPPVLSFPVAGMEIDFGGVVKEYAADRAAAACRAAGLRHGMVNLGGDVAIVGARPGGDPWRIGICHPRRPGDLVDSVLLREGALASSGDYERCIVVDGTRYGHILNPKTGWPIRHLASVSVVADLCIVAGSTSTIAMLEEGNGPAWLERVGLPHHWVDVNGRVGGSLASRGASCS